MVPSLADKPDEKPEDTEKEKGFVNPFKPYNPNRYVEDINPSHVLLLNTYSVVPHHLLIVTKEFRRQGDPLDYSDMEAIASLIARQSHPSITFYNSGPDSGASQPHKHLQVLPIFSRSTSESPPIITSFLKEQHAQDQIASSDNLPFVHYGLKLNATIMNQLPGGQDSLNPDAVAEVAGYLLKSYQRLLYHLTNEWSLLNGKPSTNSTSTSNTFSYNFVLTKECMLVVPRKHRDWQSVSMNSLGVAGLFLCKDKDSLSKVKTAGPLSVLKCVGFPK